MKFMNKVFMPITLVKSKFKIHCWCGRVIHKGDNFIISLIKTPGKNLGSRIFCSVCGLDVINAYRFKLTKIENKCFGIGGA